MKEHTRRLYAAASVLGLVEHGSLDDNFHILVHRITGKYHVSHLTETEAGKVEAELNRMLVSQGLYKPKQREDIPDMMTGKQQAMAWKLTYILAELDGNTETTVSQRLAGAVRKTLGVTAPPSDPLRWVRKDDGIKLIEALKKIATNAEKKQKKKS